MKHTLTLFSFLAALLLVGAGCSLAPTGVLEIQDEIMLEGHGEEGESEHEEEVDPEPEVMVIPSGSYIIVPESSQLAWKGSTLVVAHHGPLGIKSAAFARTDFGSVEGEVVMDMTQIGVDSIAADKGADKLVGHLASEDFFDIENYPEARFVPTDVIFGEAGMTLRGDLTILDATNEIEWLATVTEEEGNYRVAGELAFDRTEWGMNYGSGKFFDNLGDNLMDDEVILTIDFLFAPVDAAVAEVVEDVASENDEI